MRAGQGRRGFSSLLVRWADVSVLPLPRTISLPGACWLFAAWLRLCARSSPVHTPPKIDIILYNIQNHVIPRSAELAISDERGCKL